MKRRRTLTVEAGIRWPGHSLGFGWDRERNVLDRVWRLRLGYLWFRVTVT